MDLSSTLKLSIEKGPREGETLEYNSKPRLTIRIGRVARGNTIAIKEDGISTKHLSIEFCSEGKWVVKDLDSSNGTYLNTNLLPPLTVHDLRDGDVLKIGEFTSIRVLISNVSDSQIGGRSLRSGARVLGTGTENDVEKVAEGGNRRGRGRGGGRGRGRGRGDVNVGDADSETEDIAAVNSDVEVQRGRGRPKGRGKKDKDLEDESSKIGTVDLATEVNSEISENVEIVQQNEAPVSKRRTRNSKNEESKVVGDVEPAMGSRRITRSRGVKNKDTLASSSALEKIPEASQLENAYLPEKRNTRTRRGRKENEEQVSKESMPAVVEEGERLSSELVSVQENRNEVEVAVIKPEPQSNVEGIVSKGDRSSKEPLSEIVEKDGDLACQLNFEHETEKELEASLNQDDNQEPECFQESTAAEKDANSNGVVVHESTAAEKDAEAEITTDLSKMTLGEWFDYLEMALPRQIRAETDKIIEDMRKRSQQVHEFMLQQKKGKGKRLLS